MPTPQLSLEKVNEILEQVNLWLVKAGYNVEHNKVAGRIEVHKALKDIAILIYIRVIDEQNLKLTAYYLPMPIMSTSSTTINDWLILLLKREDFVADELDDENKLYIGVSKSFPLTTEQVEDDIRLYRLILDVCREFKDHYYDDVDCAAELGMVFKKKGTN
jgi:hypothetical protein